MLYFLEIYLKNQLDLVSHFLKWKKERIILHMNQRALIISQSLALEVGLREAIFLMYLKHWLDSNRRRGVNFCDGRYWSCSTYAELSARLQVFSIKQIRGIVGNLRDMNMFITRKYNRHKNDQTLWYTITDKGLALIQNCYLEMPQKANAFAHSAQSNNTNIVNNMKIQKNFNRKFKGNETQHSFNVDDFFDATVKKTYAEFDANENDDSTQGDKDCQ
jgi:hypothetical protein